MAAAVREEDYSALLRPTGSAQVWDAGHGRGIAIVHCEDRAAIGEAVATARYWTKRSDTC